MSSKKEDSSFFSYLKSSTFLRQILVIFGIFAVIILVALIWLRFYTNHGQKLELPKFIGMDIQDATDLAQDKDFDLIVVDSIFIVGKKGGIITEQNPKPLSLVKEKRKVYVTITKYGVESISVNDLPVLYGNAFEQKKAELKYRDIECIIKDYKYDPGEPNHILEVYYNGELIVSKDTRKEDLLITKGDTLEFILSRKDGGDVIVPDLRCLDLEEAKFLLSTSKLELGNLSKKGAIEPDGTMYIVSQNPPYDGITNIKMGEKISVVVSGEKPRDCQ
ncbi:MAG: PASTA domain-containing protein [Lewinellaceae bacterium]|nr:PASTA domain-containing protein [Lewinellaceae bacterium]